MRDFCRVDVLTEVSSPVAERPITGLAGDVVVVPRQYAAADKAATTAVVIARVTPATSKAGISSQIILSRMMSHNL